MNKRELTEHPDYTFDSAPRGTLLSSANYGEKFDDLIDEEMMSTLIDEDQIHNMYANYIEKRLSTCIYGEFNGKPVIGLDSIKIEFLLDMKMGNLIYEYESLDLIKGTNAEGSTYLFHVQPSTMKSALERWKL